MIDSAFDYGHIMIPKHFVANDQETNRAGVSTWLKEQSLREIYLRAFEGPLSKNEGNALGIMGSFNRIGYEQANICPELMTDILRSEWGFEGYVITDMAADNIHFGRWAIVDGTDAMLRAFANFPDLTADNMSNDLAYLESAQRAAKNVMYAYVNSNAINGRLENSYLEPVTNAWQTILVVVSVALGALAIASFALYIIASLKRKKEETPNV
jgi:beta-glucosidase